jgi:hypothetical protein
MKQIQDKIIGLALRALCLNGLTVDRQSLATVVSEKLKAYAAAAVSADARKKAAELYNQALNDPAKMRELCGLRVEQTQNYILASNNFMRLFFDVVTLKDDERPIVQNNTKQEIRVGYIGSSGSPKTVKIIKDQVETMIDLKWVSSEKVDYRLTDIYNGDVSQAAQATVDIGFDMANKMDQLCYDLLTASVANGGAFGTFTFTGNKASRVYLANSRIKTSNLPASNDITVPGSTSSTKFRFAVLKAIAKYGSQFVGAFPDGDLVPTGLVVVPALDLWDLADEITPSGSTNNKTANQILERGPMEIDYAGKNWTLIPDNTIESGVCYPQFNKRVGEVFLKPGLDKEFVDTQVEKNIEFRSQKKVFGAYITNPHRLRAARFTYKTS